MLTSHEMYCHIFLPSYEQLEITYPYILGFWIGKEIKTKKKKKNHILTKWKYRKHQFWYCKFWIISGHSFFASSWWSYISFECQQDNFIVPFLSFLCGNGLYIKILQKASHKSHSSYFWDVALSFDYWPWKSKRVWITKLPLQRVKITAHNNKVNHFIITFPWHQHTWINNWLLWNPELKMIPEPLYNTINGIQSRISGS